MQNVWLDLRIGLRSLRKSPRFTLASVAILTLGIAGSTALFTVLDATMLRPLPYAEPDRLVRLWEQNPSRNVEYLSVSPLNYTDWRGQSHSFEAFAAYERERSFTLTGLEVPEALRGTAASAELFTLFGVRPALGRTFLADEDRPGSAARPLVLSYGLWQRRFGGDAGVLGRSLQLDGQAYTVVGVMPAGFSVPRADTEFWVPLRLDTATAKRDMHYLRVLGRLRRGVSLDEARTEIASIAARLEAAFPETNTGWGARIEPLEQVVVPPELRQAVLVLFGAVLVVLLIACANVSSLLLVRAAGRSREMAIRSALGASRPRLALQLLTESLLLSLAGGCLGLLVAFWGVDLFAWLRPDTLPRAAEIQLDLRVLGFTAGVSLLTTLLFGLAPAVQSSAGPLVESLKDGTGSSPGRQRRRLRETLVVAELALALVLLVGAGLLLQSFRRLQAVDPGFRPEQVLAVDVALPKAKYAEQRALRSFYAALLERLSALPGVQSAGLASIVPFGGGSTANLFTIEGRLTAPKDAPASDFCIVSAGYFRTLDIPILRGRAFSEQDSESSPPVVVISDTLARRFFPRDSPLGHRLVLPTGQGSAMRAHEIVGVAGDVRPMSLEEDMRPMYYLLHGQVPIGSMTAVLRTGSAPEDLVEALRQQVLALDKDQPLGAVRTMEQLVAGTVAERRFNLLLLGLFAGVALVLAVLGIYAVVSYSVRQRTREIGIRMALGADRSDVLKLVVGQASALVALGAALGLAAAAGLSRVVASLLYGVSATDPMTYVAVAGLLSALALAACAVPARVATRLDPVLALKQE